VRCGAAGPPCDRFKWRERASSPETVADCAKAIVELLNDRDLARQMRDGWREYGHQFLLPRP